DLVLIGSVDPADLDDAGNQPVVMPSFLTNALAVGSNAANYSLGDSGWIGSVGGSPEVYNAGLSVAPLSIARTVFRVATEEEFYTDFAIAVGGTRPYTWSINNTNAPWLSINPSTGVLFG